MSHRRPSQRDGSSSPRTGAALWQTTRDVGEQFDGGGEFSFGHSHSWRQGDARTSVDEGHSHRVVLGRIQDNPIDGHSHTITGMVDEKGDGRFGEGPNGEFTRITSRRDAEDV